MSWLVCLVLGNLGQALAFDCFLRGHEIAAGGFGGLALVLSTAIPLNVGTIVTLISIPVFVWSYFVQGFRYTLSALLSTVAFSALVDGLAFLPTLTDSRLLAGLCGGVLYGVSAYILTRGNVAGNGTDLLARLLVTRFRSLTLGTVTMVCDGLVVLLSMFVFHELETGIYAVVTIFATSYTLDTAIKGCNKACLFQIITDQDPEELSSAIMERIDRGMTLVPARGMYEGREKNMLLVVVSPREVYAFKDLMRQICPNAFIIMSSVSEVMGEGFHGLDVTVPVKDVERREK